MDNYQHLSQRSGDPSSSFSSDIHRPSKIMDTTGKSVSRILAANWEEQEADTSGTAIQKNESLIDKSFNKIDKQLSMDKRESRHESLLLLGSDERIIEASRQFIKIEEGQNSSSSSHKIDSWQAEVSQERIGTEQTPNQ